MIKADMKRKMAIARDKVSKAIKAHGGTTILSTGITGDDARMAKAAVEAGVKMLEPNHPARILARGVNGITNMHDAEKIRHLITVDEMASVTQGIRSVVGDDIYITVGIPGGFTELLPTILVEDDFYKMSHAGADGLHVHKTSIEDLKEIVDYAHSYGLLVDAYIGHSNDLHPFGIAADTPEEVTKVATEMEAIGVDMIGMMTGMSYEGVEAGKIPNEVKERLEALVKAVNVPTLAEGGINTVNQKAFEDTGVSILVVGTAIDKIAEQAVMSAVQSFLPSEE